MPKGIRAAQRQYEPQRLGQLHREILRLLILGYSNKHVAQLLGCTPETVCNAKNSAVGAAQLGLMHMARDSRFIDAQAYVSENAGRNIQMLQELAEDPMIPPQTRARVLTDLVGIAGFVRPQRVQIQGNVTHLTLEDIERIKERARLACSEAGQLIDIESTESSEAAPGQPSLCGLGPTQNEEAK